MATAPNRNGLKPAASTGGMAWGHSNECPPSALGPSSLSPGKDGAGPGLDPQAPGHGVVLGKPRPSLSFSFVIYETGKVSVPPKAVPAKRSPAPCAFPGWQCGL